MTDIMIFSFGPKTDTNTTRESIPPRRVFAFPDNLQTQFPCQQEALNLISISSFFAQIPKQRERRERNDF